MIARTVHEDEAHTYVYKVWLKFDRLNFYTLGLCGKIQYICKSIRLYSAVLFRSWAFGWEVVLGREAPHHLFALAKDLIQVLPL